MAVAAFSVLGRHLGRPDRLKPPLYELRGTEAGHSSDRQMERPQGLRKPTLRRHAHQDRHKPSEDRLHGQGGLALGPVGAKGADQEGDNPHAGGKARVPNLGRDAGWLRIRKGGAHLITVRR